MMLRIRVGKLEQQRPATSVLPRVVHYRVFDPGPERPARGEVEVARVIASDELLTRFKTETESAFIRRVDRAVRVCEDGGAL